MAEFGSLFSNPNFLSLLAGMGARLDPSGPAGAIGGATTQAIQSQAAQRALAGQEGQRKAVNTLLAGSLLPDSDPRKKEFLDRAIGFLGGMTGPNKEGVTSVKVGPKGNFLLDITPPGTPLNQQGPISQEPSITTNAPAIVATTQTPQRRQGQFDLSSIVPFFSALQGFR